jgi:CheY-like chemotaxis protein
VSASPSFDEPAARRARVRLVGTEPAITTLLTEWLHDAGHEVQAAAGGLPSVIVVDVPFPRRDGAARVQALQRACPGTPIIVLSATLLGSVASQGAVARELGVAAVLSAPLQREALLAALAGALGQ